MTGILIVNKPAQWTSHDVVAKVRGLLREKRIGHLGTLDPLATGVLPLAVGSATRLIEFASYPKEYVATCLLGRSTDSFDITGKVLAEKSLGDLSTDRARGEVLKLRAITEQVPPMVSAVKSGGKKLYELARKGIEVERKARPIQIGKVEVLKVELPRVTFRVACSAGTYVRALCQTLGETLGVGGCMESLERTQVGPFGLGEALTLEDVKKKAEAGDLSGMLLPAARLVEQLPEVQLPEKDIRDICQGKKIWYSAIAAGMVRVLNPQGQLCAIAEVSEGRLSPRKVFGAEGLN
ncbi:MAG TPA: tRNA pseudouridine(55) synthase TruB [bacterium]|nr:tRNA pseudouridine(55) synthase TruB [bacterium]